MIKKIRWYKTLVPYIYMIDVLSYNNKNGKVTFYSNIIIDKKYVKSEKQNKEKNKKFKMGRPIG